MKEPCRLSSLIILLFCFSLFNLSAQPSDVGEAGDINGVTIWQLPNSPAGDLPDQCWLAVGSDPDGDIYISGHDHFSNSMLYRLYQDDDILRWVGDARTASLAADNWEGDETAEKFHTRPTYLNGRMYVATLDESSMDDSYLDTRGFHWYAYDIAQNEFIDLSAAETNGVGAPNMQVVTVQADPNANVMYGATIPESRIMSYDVEQGQTTDLGRPSAWDQYFYTNRFMWVDSRSRLYITGGNTRNQWYNGEPSNVFENVWYYDPVDGFGEMAGFGLEEAHCIEVGQWNREHTTLYASDDGGHIYKFEDDGPTFSYIGTPSFSTEEKVWIFNVSADEEKIYIADSDFNGKAIYEYDIATGTSLQLCSVYDMDNNVDSKDFITGYDSWDKDGCFYFSCFSMWDDEGVNLLRFDPVRVKVAKGLLPELVEVTVIESNDDVVVSRTGTTAVDLSVIYEIVGYDRCGEVVDVSYGDAIIVAGQQSITLAYNEVQMPVMTEVDHTIFSVIPDGNDYVVGTARDAAIKGYIPVEPVLSGISITSDKETVDLGGTIQFMVEGLDQCGGDMSYTGSVVWSVETLGGTIDQSGLFTSDKLEYPVVIKAIAESYEAHDTIRVGDEPYLATIDITPDVTRISPNGTVDFEYTSFDQYGNEYVGETVVWSVSSGATISQSGVFEAGGAEMTVTVTLSIDEAVTSAIVIIDEINENICLNKQAFCSSFESSQQGDFPADNAVDGDAGSRWSSDFNNPEWIYVDLADTYVINQVVLRWENAYSTSYDIQISDDGSNWTTVYDELAGNGGVEDISMDATGRYLRLYCTSRATQYGHSLYEIEAYGYSVGSNGVLANIIVVPGVSQVIDGTTPQFVAYGYDDNWNDVALDGTWSVDSSQVIDVDGVFIADRVGGPYTIAYEDGAVTGTAEVTVYTDVLTEESQIVEEIIQPLILLYPNPVKDNMILYYDLEAGETAICEVYSASGSKCYSGSINQTNTSIDLSHLQHGLYLMRIMGRDIVSSKQFIKL